jgi:dihydrofolate reductase
MEQQVILTGPARVARCTGGAGTRTSSRAHGLKRARRSLMRKLVISEWMSLDGVFDADTMPQWFEPYESDDRANYIRECIHASDALVLGRVTYELLGAYWPKQTNDAMGIAGKLNSEHKYVVSRTLKKADWSPSTILQSAVLEKIADLKQQPGKDLLVFGSATLAESLIDADLVDEYRVLVHPVIMGTGKRFFRNGMGPTNLKLVNSHTYSKGVTLFTYVPARS